MSKTPEEIALKKAREIMRDSLGEIHQAIEKCVDEGMIDTNAELYNECVDLIKQCHYLKNWDEIEELVARGKVLEQDVEAWLSYHGRSSLSLSWPHRN